MFRNWDVRISWILNIEIYVPADNFGGLMEDEVELKAFSFQSKCVEKLAFRVSHGAAGDNSREWCGKHFRKWF